MIVLTMKDIFISLLVRYHFEGIGAFREDDGGCSVGNRKQIKIP